MSAIACLYIRPSEAVCNVCARLTPVVEPAEDRIFMDWTGCGDVEQLAERLAEGLHFLEMSDIADAETPATAFADDADDEALADSTRPNSQHQPFYTLGVAPVRFVAHIVATERVEHPVTRIAGGYYVDERSLPSFIDVLPVTQLPGADIDDETKRTLSSLAIKTLGELNRVQRDLLRSHVGDVADTLLAWSRGVDPRPVASLYPPERLQQHISGDLFDEYYASAATTVATAVTTAVNTLFAQLRSNHQAVAQLSVEIDDHRQMRSFTPPLGDEDQLVRTVRQMVERSLATIAGDTDQELEWDVDRGVRPTFGDLVIEIVPTDRERKQTSLWQESLFDAGHRSTSHRSTSHRSGHRSTSHRSGHRSASASATRLSTGSLSDITAEPRLVPNLRPRARDTEALDGIRRRFSDIIVRHAAPREAVARYEAMFRLYKLGG